MTRIPLATLVVTLSEQPTPVQLEAARIADLRAGWSESEARRARADGLDGIADAHLERARACRREVLHVLGLEP